MGETIRVRRFRLAHSAYAAALAELRAAARELDRCELLTLTEFAVAPSRAIDTESDAHHTARALLRDRETEVRYRAPGVSDDS